jgi:hypothetical protein
VYRSRRAAHLASHRLHAIKKDNGLGPADNVIIGRTEELAILRGRVAQFIDGALITIRMSEDEKPNAKFRHMYAIVRIDLPVNQEAPEDSVTVIKVFSSRITAEHELSRLNRINREKACRYVLQTTRLVPSFN